MKYKYFFLYLLFVLLFNCSLFHYFGDELEKDLDEVAPILTVYNPSDGESFTSGNVKVTGNAFDQKSGLEGVYYYRGEDFPQKITVDVDWSYDLNLPDGINVLNFYAIDNSGNKSEVITVTVYINEQFNAVLEQPQDNFITNKKNVDIKVKINKGFSDIEGVYLKIDNTGDYKIADALQIDESGYLNYTLDNLVEKTYNLGVYAKDVRGVASQTVFANVVVDLTAPKISVTDPSSDNKVFGSSISIGGGIVENNNVNAVYCALDDKSLLGTPESKILNFANGFWNHNLSSLKDGTRDIFVLAEDQAGNKSEVARRTFLVDTSIPSVVIEYPAVNEGFYLKGDVTVDGVADGGKFPLSAVYVSLNGGEYVKAQLFGEGKWGYSFKNISDGFYFLDVYCENVNKIRSPLSANYQFTVNTSTPSGLSLLSTSDSGSYDFDRITNYNNKSGRNLIFEGTFFGSFDIELYNVATSGVIAKTKSDALGVWSVILLDELSDGVYNFNYCAKDGFGNKSPFSPSFELKIDSLSPNILTFTGVTDGLSYNSDITISISGIETGAIVMYSIDGGISWSDLDYLATSNQLTFNADAIYSFRLRHSDLAGNFSDTGVTNFTIDKTPPVVSISSPLDSAIFSKNDQIKFGGAADDGVFGSKIISYQWFIGSIEITPVTSVTPNTSILVPTFFKKGSDLVTTSGAGHGSHIIKLRVTDAVGNVGEATATIKVLDNQDGGINITF